MAFDPRQVVAAFLTLSMFAMLGNMIKKDHFDSNEVKHPTLAVQFDVMKVEEHISMEKKGPWMEKSSVLKSCWNRPASKEGDKGFITFSLTTGPEYHFSQFFKYIFRDWDFGGQDIKVSLEVSFMEAVQGCTKTLSFQAPVSCEACDGSGVPSGTRPETCNSCRGSGMTFIQQGPSRLQSTCF